MSKEAILSSVKEALKGVDYTKKEVKKADINIKNDGDIIENCIANLRANRTEVITCDESDLFEHAQSIINRLQIKKVLHFSNAPFDANLIENAEIIPYDKSVNEMSETLFECDMSLLKARLAVSNLGIFCITSDEQPRLMSLLPQACIVFIKKEDIVASINEANAIFSQGELPTNIVYIGGPSRTADIELQICLGVHGPKDVFALIY